MEINNLPFYATAIIHTNKSAIIIYRNTILRIENLYINSKGIEYHLEANGIPFTKTRFVTFDNTYLEKVFSSKKTPAFSYAIHLYLNADLSEVQKNITRGVIAYFCPDLLIHLTEEMRGASVSASESSSPIDNYHEVLVDSPLQAFIKPNGPVTHAYFQNPVINFGNNQLEIYSAVAHHLPPTSEHLYAGAQFIGSGCADTPEQAIIVAIAEAVERHGSATPDPNKIQFTPTKTLYADERLYAYIGIDPEAYLGNFLSIKPPQNELWPTITAQIVSEGESDSSWQVPIDLAYYPYKPYQKERFCIANSSGVALGTSLEDASMRALREYSERHTLAVLWLSNSSPNIINRQSMPSDIQNLINKIETMTNASIHLCHDYRNGMHHIFCIYEGKTLPYFHLTAAAHESISISSYKAIKEMVNAIAFCAHFRMNRDITSVYDAIDHYGFYHSEKRAKIALDWSLGGMSIDWPEDDKKNSSNILELSKKCFDEFGEISVIDMTPKYLETTPYKLVRIITKEGIPFWFGCTDLPNRKKAKNGIKLNWDRWIHPMG